MRFPKGSDLLLMSRTGPFGRFGLGCIPVSTGIMLKTSKKPVVTGPKQPKLSQPQVINGVFMQETLRVAQSDDVIMMRDVARRDRCSG